MSASKPSNNSNCSNLYLQACGILLAAATLGFAYNHASPLGVRAPSAEEKANPSAAISAEKISPTAGRTGYVNQTIAMSLESAAPNQPAAPLAVAPSNQPHFPELKWPQVKTLVASKQIVLVDARLKANYDTSHIPGAVSLPANSPAAELQAFATQYPKETRFVVYCGSATCHMSRALAESLFNTYGYKNVSEMPGGFAEYLAAESGAIKTAKP